MEKPAFTSEEQVHKRAQTKNGVTEIRPALNLGLPITPAAFPHIEPRYINFSALKSGI